MYPTYICANIDAFLYSQHPSAARIYVDVGAIEFISQLKPNVNETLHKLIDGILDNLYHIPDGPEFHTADCIVYVQKPNSGEGNAYGYIPVYSYYKV